MTPLHDMELTRNTILKGGRSRRNASQRTHTQFHSYASISIAFSYTDDPLASVTRIYVNIYLRSISRIDDEKMVRHKEHAGKAEGGPSATITKRAMCVCASTSTSSEQYQCLCLFRQKRKPKTHTTHVRPEGSLIAVSSSSSLRHIHPVNYVTPRKPHCGKCFFNRHIARSRAHSLSSFHLTMCFNTLSNINVRIK